MHTSKKTHPLPRSKAVLQYSGTVITLTAGLLVAAASMQLQAAQDSYRITEGHSNSESHSGSDLMPSLDSNALTTLSKTPLGNDNHLTLLPSNTLWLATGIWISDIGTLLYLDDDQDGYFSGFSLSIDADTDYAHADVYATIDIQRTAAVRERLHTTRPFSIYGNSIADEYRIDIELVRDYPIGDYDLFVSLIDGNDHSVVDSLGAEDLRNLSRLPLESEDFDNSPSHFEPQAIAQAAIINTDIRTVEYSGASSHWLLIVLAIPGLTRKWIKNHRFNQD